MAKDKGGHGSEKRGGSGPASYQNVSTKPLVSNATRARLAAARTNPDHPLGALTTAVNRGVAAGGAIAGIPAFTQGLQPMTPEQQKNLLGRTTSLDTGVHTQGVQAVGHPLAGMTQGKWDAMNPAQKDAVRDNGSLS